MAVSVIDAKMLAKMFLAGAQNLENKKEWINELNVFPVPDGDTGTNMSLTMKSSVKELNMCTTNDMETVCDAISKATPLELIPISGTFVGELI